MPGVFLAYVYDFLKSMLILGALRISFLFKKKGESKINKTSVYVKN